MASIRRAGRLNSPVGRRRGEKPVEERLDIGRHRVEPRQKRAVFGIHRVVYPAFQRRCGVLYQVLHLGDNEGRSGNPTGAGYVCP